MTDAAGKKILAQIAANKITHPNNLAAKHFDMDYYNSLSPALRKRLLQIIKTGAENADSGMGCYAMNPDDYDTFKPFFDAVIREYHKIPGEVHHVTNWDLKTVADKLPAGGKLDLTQLGLGTSSMRVRVGQYIYNICRLFNWISRVSQGCHSDHI